MNETSEMDDQKMPASTKILYYIVYGGSEIKKADCEAENDQAVFMANEEAIVKYCQSMTVTVVAVRYDGYRSEPVSWQVDPDNLPEYKFPSPTDKEDDDEL